ncbi:boron transporter 4-like isoform X2 [Canna indica]|uniref:Boron transporter 4-like isoform X2 n=1 Tax=Canna indica TaxID=4628 RepID=A0AAQ3JYU1_9LILI|nr:boron transporter 4-like isoform X2 [Canna indica]
MVAGLYFFDHNVASQLAQQKEFNLKNGRGFYANGQGEQTCIIESCLLQTDSVNKELKNLKDAVMCNKIDGEDSVGSFDPDKHIEAHLPVRVNEQTVTNLLQSLLVGAYLAAMPIIRMIPTSILWGYFAYMAIDSLLGKQFWERMLFLFVTPDRRFKVLQSFHASFVESVPFRQIANFTIFQFLYLLLCFDVTWIPVAGILFPLPFFLLISIRQHILPKFFHRDHLYELDSSEYDEISSDPHRKRSQSIFDVRDDDLRRGRRQSSAREKATISGSRLGRPSVETGTARQRRLMGDDQWRLGLEDGEGLRTMVTVGDQRLELGDDGEQHKKKSERR